jgi:hypothetical protein
MSTKKPKPGFTGIRDRSYEAYVEFMLATMKGMTGNEVTTYDEEKMRKRWKEFWAEEDAADSA